MSVETERLDSQLQYQPIEDSQLCPRLKELIRPELQRYLTEPPRYGMGIVYVEVSPPGKMYVGQHIHGRTGKSYMATRFADKKAQWRQDAPLIANAFKKYGPENMRSFIVAHCVEGKRDMVIPGDTNDLEERYIAELGTLKPNGYNLKKGGLNGKHHPATILLLKQNAAKPEAKHLRIKSAKSSWNAQRSKSASTDVQRRNIERPEIKERINQSNRDRQAADDSKVLESQLAQCNSDSDRETVLSEHENKLEQRKYNASKTRLFRERKKYGVIVVTKGVAKRAKDVENATIARKKTQLLKDAKKWIPMFASCTTEQAALKLAHKYEMLVARRAKDWESKKGVGCV